MKQNDKKLDSLYRRRDKVLYTIEKKSKDYKVRKSFLVDEFNKIPDDQPYVKKDNRLKCTQLLLNMRINILSDVNTAKYLNNEIIKEIM